MMWCICRSSEGGPSTAPTSNNNIAVQYQHLHEEEPQPTRSGYMSGGFSSCIAASVSGHKPVPACGPGCLQTELLYGGLTSAVATLYVREVSVGLQWISKTEAPAPLSTALWAVIMSILLVDMAFVRLHSGRRAGT
ncbi:hypothetical protein INR49_031489 [Caranx melampygus]|nr:hypothetical protein INR49_031489 [Caranx melampygus]